MIPSALHACVTFALLGAPPEVKVPPSPFLPLVYKHADAILEAGFTLETGRAQAQENWLRVLYTLSELSSKPKYREAADSALKKYLTGGGGIEAGGRAWVLWDRCFSLAPEAAEGLVEALGAHAGGQRAGFRLRALATAYARTGDVARLRAVEELSSSLAQASPEISKASPAAMIALAIDCDGVSRMVPEPVSSRLRALASRLDDAFCALPQDGPLAAQVAMMCVSRYENTGRTAYRDLILKSADALLASELAAATPPATYGHAISLELAAWRSSARVAHLDRARAIAEKAVKAFQIGSGPPSHAEGLDTLTLALVELHLSILHITAVRCPPNTVDR